MQFSLRALARAALKPVTAQIAPAPPSVTILNNSVQVHHPEVGLQHAEFPFVWLRDACQSSVDSSTRQKLFKTTDIPRQIQATEASVVGGQLKVHWNMPLRPSKSFSTLVSVYPLEFLARHASRASLQSYLRLDEPIVHWNASRLTRDNLVIPYAQFQLPEVRHAALRQALSHGIVFFSGVPVTDRSDAGCELVKLASSLGCIRRTWYGEHSWDVQSIKNSKNIAYTNLDLGLHMDLVHYDDPPRYQLLHYLHRAKTLTGGLSYFVDSYHAALQLQQQHPKMFKLLSEEKMAFEYNNGGHFRYYERPTFELNEQGRITAVNYSPPFQAPLSLDGRSAGLLDRLLEALQTYADLLEDSTARFEIDMQPGDVVLFDNRRTLHARTAFQWDEQSDEPIGRWLKGCYVEGDSLLDSYRQCRRP